jgi:hypothetical protein
MIVKRTGGDRLWVLVSMGVANSSSIPVTDQIKSYCISKQEIAVIRSQIPKI